MADADTTWEQIWTATNTFQPIDDVKSIIIKAFQAGGVSNILELYDANGIFNFLIDATGGAVFANTLFQINESSDLATPGSVGLFAVASLSTNRTYTFPDFSMVVAGSTAALTSGRVPIVTTSGRLTDDADLTFATDTLTATKLVGTTSIKAAAVGGYKSSDGSAGATGSFTTTDLKTVTVKDGIITNIV